MHGVGGLHRHWAQLLLVMLDGMFDRVYPVLNMYGDAIEGLDLRIETTGPNAEAVRLGHLLKRRIERLRRYAWDSRYLLSEISQDQFDVFPANVDSFPADPMALLGESGKVLLESPRARSSCDPAAHVKALLQSGLAQASDVSWTCNAWRKRCEAIGAQFDRCIDGLLFGD